MTTFEFTVNGRRRIVEANNKRDAYAQLLESFSDSFAVDLPHTIHLVESYEGRREIAELRVNGMIDNPYRYDLSEELGYLCCNSATHKNLNERRAAGEKILIYLEKYFAENKLTVVSTKTEQ